MCTQASLSPSNPRSPCSTVASHPRVRPPPTAGQHLEDAAPPPATNHRCPKRQSTNRRVTGIGPDQPQPRKPAQQLDVTPAWRRPGPECWRMDTDGQKQVHSVHYDVPFASGYLLARVVASGPPFSVVFTDWLSMMAALGLVSRPWACRSMACSVSWTRCQVPSRRQVRK